MVVFRTLHKRRLNFKSILKCSSIQYDRNIYTEVKLVSDLNCCCSGFAYALSWKAAQTSTGISILPTQSIFSLWIVSLCLWKKGRRNPAFATGMTSVLPKLYVIFIRRKVLKKLTQKTLYFHRALVFQSVSRCIGPVQNQGRNSLDFI